MTNRKEEIKNIVKDLEDIYEAYKEGLLSGEEFIEDIKHTAEGLTFFDIAQELNFDRKEDEKVMSN